MTLELINLAIVILHNDEFHNL